MKANHSTGQNCIIVKPESEKTWGQSFAEFFGVSSYSRTYALIVGVSRFENFDVLPTTNDPIRLANLLVNLEDFDYVHVVTEEFVTREYIQELMVDTYPELIGENDRFLFYWSGHGVTRRVKNGKRGYLPVQNSTKGSYSKMISMRDFQRWDGLLNAKQVLYLLDSCFSGLAGAVPQSDNILLEIEDIARPSRHILVAGEEGQKTFASDALGGSVFTRALIDGINGEADAESVYNKDGVVTLSELKGYVRKRVDKVRRDQEWKTPITPQLRDLGESNGEFFFFSDTKGRSGKNLKRNQAKTSVENSKPGKESGEKIARNANPRSVIAKSGEENSKIHKDRVRYYSIKREIESAEYAIAEKENTIESYQGYIKKFPKGSYVVQAERKMNFINGKKQKLISEIKEENLWNAAKLKNDYKIFNIYLSMYPNGKFAKEARSRLLEIENREWKLTHSKGSKKLYFDFLKKFPKGQFAEEAYLELSKLDTHGSDLYLENADGDLGQKYREHSIWLAAVKQNTVKSYRNYLDKFPQGIYFQDANSKLVKIEAKEWDLAITKGTKEAYQEYLSNYPNGKFTEKARLRMHILSGEYENPLEDQRME